MTRLNRLGAGSTFQTERVGASRRGRLLVAGAAGLMFLGVSSWAGAVVPDVQPSPTGALSLVNAGPGDQTDPHVSGNLVSYTDFSVSPSQIRYHDLATDTDAAIPSVQGGDDSLSAVSGTAVVYVHFDRDHISHDIYYYDTATSAPPVELAPQAVSSNRRRASIGGTTVAWQDFGFSGLASPEIVAYDRTTGIGTRLTDDLLYDRDPVVDPSGTVITWAKCTSIAGGCDIWDATLAGGVWAVHQLTTDAAEESSPNTNGSIVTYASDRGGDSDIRWQPVGGGAEEVLTFPGNDQNPHLSGNVITFEHYQATDPTPNFEIYAYNVTTNALYRLTQSPEDDSLNGVWSDPSGAVHAVWSTRVATGDDNVYAFTFVIPTTTDTTAPVISIATPADHAAYTLNQAVTADYTCADEPGGSGVASCAGPTPNGSLLDTASVGTKSFAVSAADNAGNTATRSVAYSVSYRICPLFDEDRSHRGGRTIPVQVRLCDDRGVNVSSPNTVLTATTVAKKDGTEPPRPATDAGRANPGNTFRYHLCPDSYSYNLSTKGLSGGTWVLTFTASGDPQPHTVEFDVRGRQPDPDRER